jgi:hypothetical protein
MAQRAWAGTEEAGRWFERRRGWMLEMDKAKSSSPVS